MEERLEALERRLRRRTFAELVVFMMAAVVVLASPFCSLAGEPMFRVHAINPESTFSACAAVDVNRDGRLDVVCGGWWYEAPTWKRHFLREVEVIRGRYDDYSNLPLDVNRDGWPDLISANYRSKTMYWIAHPQSELGAWPTYKIAAPGPSETARLVDVDMDGNVDLLPNGTTYAAWWELLPRGKSSSAESVRWVRHELPKELAAHGIGFGDLDGDGRSDLVGPRGWFRAPRDPRGEDWQWQPEFRLHRDCSIPILVFDVDADGDNDVVWARGHSTGLYWFEQQSGRLNSSEQQGRVGSNNFSKVRRRWVFHAIDTSWSQAHCLLVGDLDGDGQSEVIAGKRYLGHEGRDLGEYDPMMICAYQYDVARRTWRRRVVSEGGPAGFGLDPKLADLDSDGDLDLLCPGRSGLYWIENLRIATSPAPEIAHPRPEVPHYPDHSKLLVYVDSEGNEQPVTNPAEWGVRRAHILRNLQRVMGELPDSSRRVPLDVEVVAEVKTPRYLRRKLTFAADEHDRVPAYLLIPHDADALPAMLCLHQTTPLGKDEPAGLGGDPHLHYADELARRGYVCLVPDYPSLGEYDYDFSRKDNAYASGSMKALWNNIRAIDLLESLPEVDRDRIGCIGHSLGGHNALFTAVFDQRIKAVVASCAFSAFHDDDLPSWSGDRTMPRIRDVYGNDPDRMPFDFHEVVAALAPRPFFLNAPIHDRDFDVVGVKKVLNHATGVYELLTAGDQMTAVFPNAPHDFPDVERNEAYDWLSKHLK